MLRSFLVPFTYTSTCAADVIVFAGSTVESSDNPDKAIISLKIYHKIKAKGKNCDQLKITCSKIVDFSSFFQAFGNENR